MREFFIVHRMRYCKSGYLWRPFFEDGGDEIAVSRSPAARCREAIEADAEAKVQALRDVADCNYGRCMEELKHRDGGQWGI